jgi:putative flippase GtrA
LTKKTKLFNQKDLLAYFFIAGAGAIVQLVSGGLIKDWFKLPYESSILPAYYISLIVGFILTKLFAFDARKSQHVSHQGRSPKEWHAVYEGRRPATGSERDHFA